MDAPKDLKQIIEQNQAYLIKCADFFYRQKKYALAEEIYKAILAKDTKQSVALKGLGACLYYQQNYPGALRCFLALEKLFPNENANIWIYACLMSQGKKEEAKTRQNKTTQIEAELKKAGIILDLY